MAENNLPALKSHNLSHVGQLKVSNSIFEFTFARGCSTENCNATCCHYGVMVDLEERDTILAHVDTIKKHMQPHQDKDHTQWFESEDEIDLDFPSGRAVGTQIRDYGCVFLDNAGRCVLQTAAVEDGMSKIALKPFFCFAYPITIENGVLKVDDPNFTERHECCSCVPNGEQPVLKVCKEELFHVLGHEGVKELEEIARRREANPS